MWVRIRMRPEPESSTGFRRDIDQVAANSRAAAESRPPRAADAWISVVTLPHSQISRCSYRQNVDSGELIDPVELVGCSVRVVRT